MQKFWELIFGLRPGFLSQEGQFSLQFNPRWPWQDVLGAGLWNFVLVVLAIALVVYVYRREGRPRAARIILGSVRLGLLILLIALLNRPSLLLSQNRIEPSVVAVMIDDSISMRVRDADGSEGQPTSRLQRAIELLSEGDQALLRQLAAEHQLRLYRFHSTAQPLGAVADLEEAKTILQDLTPDGGQTRLVDSLRTVLSDLQGQRLAGVVILTDGRETPSPARAEQLQAVKDFGVRIFPVAVGAEDPPRNIAVTSLDVQETAFKDDFVAVTATIRATGFAPGYNITVNLKDQATGRVLGGVDGAEASRVVSVPGDEPFEVELTFKPQEVGTMELAVEATPEPAEIDEEDNIRQAQLEVLDAQIRVLYVDGYPRWDYRYLKNEMMRERTVEISCLLLSADPTFAQEGDRPIRRFPESITELLEYDVVLFGDVDPRYFSDAQLELIRDFVANRGGGFGMVAGTRWSPAAYRNTAIEPILPVNIQRADSSPPPSNAMGFRPLLTPEGHRSSIFRFFADRDRNRQFIENEWQPLFWYKEGITAKPGVGEVFAEHPSDIAHDGRRAPIIVLGRYGAGRTFFSAIDDSWRWRYYTGESIFDTFWIQTFRYLARSKKLGQRKLTFVATQPVYELGEQVRLNLRVLDPVLLQQLPEQISVEIVDDVGQVIRQETIRRQQGQPELYTASWTADRVGRFRAVLPSVAGGIDPMQIPLEVAIPRLELLQPQVDRTLLSRLASETMGQSVSADQAASILPAAVTSMAQVIPIDTEEPLWDAPVALVLFVLLITLEWVLRKAYGML